MLPEMMFRSSDLPPAERFDQWRELMSQTHAPMDMRSGHAVDFWVNQRTISLGEATVYPLECNSLTFRRTPKLIRRSDPEAFHLSLVKRGTGLVTMGKDVISHGVAEYHTSDSSRAFEVDVAHESFEVIGVELPRALLPLPARTAAQAIGKRISARNGMGALLATFLDQLAKDSRSYQPADGPRLTAVLADLIAALFAGVLEADRSLTPETHRRALTLRVMEFIRNNADDPCLGIPAIAAAHHISVSYLHRLFQREGDGTTVAGYLQRQRLLRARRDLADPVHKGLPVYAIAARRGFSHASAFSRAFRDAYGVTPAAFRGQCLALRHPKSEEPSGLSTR
ncbi:MULTISPECIES: helix-turn-helix domain-containing protein [Streptomyces]|uniref:AraC family transcriptional regulator n=1 Tax=Streptomyces viridochromogenes TaxID=1938 RepID=A0A0L8L333_STRVR|nr:MULTISPECIES: helix-turn-helix domain-containing protein [Streptomyces]KOG32530.1 AraC family transcriptional regulator [Streptomyces viridochromogenes]